MFFVHGHAVFLVDDELDGQGAADRFLGRRGDTLVVGVGVEGVAVVVDGGERLEGRADVVELDVLGVEGASAGLNVCFQLLRAFIGAVLVAHGNGPDAPGDAVEHGILGVHAI